MSIRFSCGLLVLCMFWGCETSSVHPTKNRDLIDLSISNFEDSLLDMHASIDRDGTQDLAPPIRSDRGREEDAFIVVDQMHPDQVVDQAVDQMMHTSNDQSIEQEIDQGSSDPCHVLYLNEFVSRLWPQIFQPRCSTCHHTQGIAQNTSLTLYTEAQRADTWAEDNLEQILTLARTQIPDYDQRSLLELKPSNTISHGGASVLPPNGALHQQLVDFINRVQEQSEEECQIQLQNTLQDVPYYEGIRFITPYALLRRLALSLANRLPSDEEEALVDEQGLDGVATILDQMLESEAFVERIKEGFDDILMTRGYTAVAGAVLSYFFFPTRHWHQELYVPPESYLIVNQYEEALRREPVELIAHVVRNNLPFSEILTADYTMVSPFTARGYGVFESIQNQFSNPDDPFEFIPTTLPVRVHRNGTTQISPTGHYPHAGVLTTPQFLHRYQSTDTNRNRARARHFYKLFLGFDIMTSAPAVSDSAATTAMFAQPTLEAPECVSCHQMIDPIAGLFQDYNNEGEFHFRDVPWFTDMFSSGFEGVVRPLADMGRPLQWLAEQSVQDERFAVAMAEHAYYILTQEKLLTIPQANDENFAALLRGYQAQREAIHTAAIRFRTSAYQFKELFRSLIFSNFYRADGVEATVDPQRLTEFYALGLGALLTPEQLIRKVDIIFGEILPMDRTNPDQRRSTYLLYGGIDYNQVTERSTVPNGVMGALMIKHANHLACRIALKEFWMDTLEADELTPYRLFPFVDEDTIAEDLIRQNLVHLHHLLLGQRLNTDDAEINRSYDLFHSVRIAGVERIQNGGDQRLVYDCRREQSVPNDADYVMRSWQAVLTYLLRRPEFLLQ